MKLTRKLFALALVLCMVCSLSITAFAAVETTSIKKTYSKVGDTAVSPAETFQFTITAGANEIADGAQNVQTPEIGADAIHTTEFTASGEDQEATFTVDLPVDAYKHIGVYYYTITEVAPTTTDGKTAGVEYNVGTNKQYTMKVTVVNTADMKDLEIAYVAIRPGTATTGDNKSDAAFENTYSAGTLEVTKKVEGQMASKDKAFTIDVTFTATDVTVKNPINYTVAGTAQTPIPAGWTGTKTVQVQLKDDQTATFTNLPYGVTYEVSETISDADKAANWELDKIEFDDTNKKIDTEKDTVTVTNKNTTPPDTGIVLDSMPYILTLAIAFIGGAALVMKKRYSI